MNRFALILSLALLGSCGTADYAHAQLFGRRGCSTGCFTPHVQHVAPAVIKHPDYLQTFIFNNIAPPGDLSPRADTLYGVSRALEYNSPNSALYLDNARRALEVSSEFTAAARGVDSEILEAASIDARGRAVEAAFRALKPDIQTRSTTTTIRLKNGFPVIEEEPVPRGALSELSCLKCHTGDGAGVAKYSLEGPLTLEHYMAGEAAIEAGTMPPKKQLSPSEKAAAKLQLGKLVP